MSYPRTIDDLKPSQRVSGPVVTIDYDLLDGIPSEAREAILKAVAVMERLGNDPSPRKNVVAYRRPLTDDEADKVLAKAQFDWRRLERLHARFSRTPADRDLFDRPARHEVNAWAIEENKPLIEIG
jgi:hypothetical protein